MHQLVFIHGGETFDTYEEYLDALRSWDCDPSWEQGRRWKNTLPIELGESWQVLMPSMPSKYNAKYAEWEIWFQKVVPHLTDGVVLVGHSLGGIFLAKFMSHHSLPVRVTATFLIAAPFDTEDTGYTLADFKLPESFELFAKQAGRIFLYHSKDDSVVPFSALAKYHEKLPTAVERVFADRDHFLQEEFPELIEDIRTAVKP